MQTIQINIKDHSKTYPIIMGAHILSKINDIIDVSKFSSTVIICDEHTHHYAPEVKSNFSQPVTIIQIKSGEKEKTIETVQYLWQEFMKAQLDRKSLVINLGGGVIGDMGGFAAATYMRGIAFMQIPTTLLSMVDASIGGKVGINFGDVKNVIGSFQQPIAVIIDTETLKTLPDRDFTSGFAEIIKHGLIDDKTYFELVTTKKPRDFSPEELIDIINGSCQIKARVVETDEHEMGLRKILNFGHTIGHAVEILSAETAKPLMHGEAIAIGMVAEAKISEALGYISELQLKIIENALIQAHLPTKVTTISLEKILEKIHTDKKNSHGRIKWTLLQEIGKADYNIEVGENFVKQAVNYITNTL